MSQHADLDHGGRHRSEHRHGSDAHAGHSHGISAYADHRKLAIALSLIVGLMIVEVAVGVLSHSLALLSDAAHMLTDAAALGMSLYALKLAARPAKGAMTYGFKRAEILSAQVNGATLLVLGLLIVYEGVNRLLSPPHVAGLAVLLVALLGVLVNLLATYTLSKANRDSMNIEGAFQHILTDLAAFIATAVAGAIILATGFARADGIASLIIAAIMLRAAYSLLKASGRVLLEAAPEELDVQDIGEALAQCAMVSEVHDLHVWELGSGFPALSAHILVPKDAPCHEIRWELEQLIRRRFDIEHTTLQVDHEPQSLLSIGDGASAGRPPGS